MSKYILYTDICILLYILYICMHIYNYIHLYTITIIYLHILVYLVLLPFHLTMSLILWKEKKTNKATPDYIREYMHNYAIYVYI